MKHSKSLTFATIYMPLFLILFVSFALTSAQTSDCPVIVASALKTAQQVCSGTGRDQACYGNLLVDAEAQTGLGPLSFQQPGDIVDLAALRSLKLSPMDIEQGVWGLARLELRANLAAAQPKNVTLLMFGDVQVENAVQPAATFDISNVVGEYVNVRLVPSDKAGIVGTLAPEQTVQAIGRLQDNSWLRVKLPDSGAAGWVYAPFFSAEDDLNVLAVLEAKTPHFEPMQAFYFTSGADTNPPCAEMPASGLLIQTPEGMGKVSLLINEVKINIGSTVFFQAQPGQMMSVSTIEGAASVEVNGVQYTAYAGTTVTVPLNDDLSPSGAPNAPVPYDLELLQNLPLEVLPALVVVLPPMASEQISEHVAADICPACNAGGSPNENANGGKPDCAGNSCTPPGQNDSCPGNSCNIPGGGSGNANAGGSGNAGGNGNAGGGGKP